MKTKSIILLFLLVGFYTVAQQNAVITEKDYPVRYKKAVQLFANEQYQDAQNEFALLTSRKFVNAMVPYAHYYHALSSYKLKKYFDARITLRQLVDRYPDWSKIDDAYYFFADACLADNYFDEGLQYINRLTNPTLKREAIDLQYFYFSRIKDLNQLKALNTRFGSNSIIAERLVDAIQRQKNVSREDLELSDKLTNRFNIGVSESTETKKKTKVSDNSTVNIALFLPFKLNEFSASSTNRSNQYIYDMLEGMKLAKQKLESEKINVNLYSYDVDRSADPIVNVVKNPNFEEVDLIIGPLYPEANKITNTFAKENNVAQLHPLSNNLQLVQTEKNVFLGQPSYEIQSQKAIEHVMTVNPVQSVSIYFGNTRRDSTFAYIYRDKAIEKGFSVLTIKRYTNPESIDSRKPGHIFIVGSEDNFGPKVVSAIDRKKLSVPVVATSSAFDFEGGSLSVFNRQLFLIKTDFIDSNKEDVKIFRSNYIASQNIVPSYYSYLGYDYVLFFGRILNNVKDSIRKELDSIEYTQGFTLSGFDYTNGANDNHIVPIVRYQDGKFIEVTR